jgi:aminopeptidase N
MREPALALCLLLAIPASPLAAQTNTARMANDAYTRSHDYDLIHQTIRLSEFNWDSTSFNGTVTTTLVALRPGLDSVILDAGHLLTIQRVTSARGARLRFTTPGDTLVVFPPRPVAFHDSLTFTVTYAAKVDNGRGLTFITPDGMPHRPQQIWSQGEAQANHFWFPTYDFPNDKMSWDMIVTLPREYSAVSNGALVSDVAGAHGAHTVHWREQRPSATYLVSLIVAPLVQIKDAWVYGGRRVPVDYYVYRADSARAWRLFHPTVDMIDVYSRLTGLPYPWAKYAQTTVADFFGGMENVSATTLVDWLPDARAYQDRPWYEWILIPHELAHQWFGDYVTTENWANTWLNEGFAEFMPGQYWLEKLGPHAADDYYSDEYHQFMQIDQRRRMPLAAMRSNNIYPKGALVLRMLKHYLGPQRFWASLHTYLERHAFGVATTDDLRQAALQATGENLDWFWSEWMYGAGYPEFAVTASYDTAGHGLTLTVKQTQTDTATADSTGLRYETPLVFRMPVTVRVGTAGEDVTQSFDLTAREQQLVVHDVPSPPTYVIFDDGNGILKTLDFDEPTAWLAAQLTHDPDLWNREWVIGQLARRKDDSAAVRALAEAATGADYWLTRSQAAEALGGVGEAAVATLERVLGDTSAQVRSAAVAALGDVGGDRAVELINGASQRDSSYAVRAEAILALAAADAPNLRTAIIAGLRTPSYRGAIQNGALGAIARSGDTTFLTTVDSLVPTSQAAPYALAALANNGSTHALDLLAARLDDDHEFVRQRAAQAFDAVRPDVALHKLEAVRDSLTHEDTKRMVEQVIERLQHGRERQR